MNRKLPQVPQYHSVDPTMTLEQRIAEIQRKVWEDVNRHRATLAGTKTLDDVWQSWLLK